MMEFERGMLCAGRAGDHLFVKDRDDGSVVVIDSEDVAAFFAWCRERWPEHFAKSLES